MARSSALPRVAGSGAAWSCPSPALPMPHVPIGPRSWPWPRPIPAGILARILALAPAGILAPILAPLAPGPYPILIPPPRGIPRATIDHADPAPPRHDQSAPRSAPGPEEGNKPGKRLDQSAPRSAPSPPPIGSGRGGAGGAVRTWRPERG